MQDLIQTIAERINVDPALAEKVAGSVFSVMQHSAPDVAAKIFAILPDAQGLADTHNVMTADQGGGLMGALTGLMGNISGDKMGALVKSAAILKNAGLSNDQITQAGEQVMNHIRSSNPQLVDELIAQVPALKGTLGA